MDGWTGAKRDLTEQSLSAKSLHCPVGVCIALLTPVSYFKSRVIRQAVPAGLQQFTTEGNPSPADFNRYFQ